MCAVRPASSESEALSSRRLSRQLGPATPGPVGPAPPPPTAGDGHNHPPGEGHEHPAAAESEAGGDAGGDGTVADPAAGKAADTWLRAFSAGDAAKLSSRSSLPFFVGEQIVARTREELTGVLGSMLEEAGGKPGASTVYTAGGLRKRFGSVPSGVMEGLGRNYAVTKLGGEVFILLLEKHFGTWKVVGVAR